MALPGAVMAAIKLLGARLPTPAVTYFFKVLGFFYGRVLIGVHLALEPQIGKQAAAAGEHAEDYVPHLGGGVVGQAFRVTENVHAVLGACEKHCCMCVYACVCIVRLRAAPRHLNIYIYRE
jgi:hypothetical protein